MEQGEWRAILSKSIFGCDTEAVAAASQIARIQHLRRGDVLINEGDPADSVFLLVRGSMTVTLIASDGQEIWLDAPELGDLIGEMAVLKGEAVRSATVTARSACSLVRFKRSDFIGLLQNHGKVGIALSSLLADRLQETTRRLGALAAEQIRDRLFAELIRISAKTDEQGWRLVETGVSQSELAQRTLSKRETISRTLKKLEAAGLVRRSGRKLFVRSVDTPYNILRD